MKTCIKLSLICLSLTFVVVQAACSLGENPPGNKNDQASMGKEIPADEVLTYINEMTLAESPRQNLPAKEILLGKWTRQQRDSLLVPIDAKYANRTGMFLQKEVMEAFLEMHSAALQDGVELKIISAFRDFEHQKRIWENKWNGRQNLSGNISATSISDPMERALEILRFSAMPGTSRHHWGTDIDINSLSNSYFLSGKGKREYDWLVENAHRFGFFQPYTSRELRNNKGYEEEKWHWSYKPLASVYLSTFSDSVSYNDIAGFDGWETARLADVIKNYVLAVCSGCKE